MSTGSIWLSLVEVNCYSYIGLNMKYLYGKNDTSINNLKLGIDFMVLFNVVSLGNVLQSPTLLHLLSLFGRLVVCRSVVLWKMNVRTYFRKLNDISDC